MITKGLQRFLKKTKHKWLITYDDSKYIKNLFSFAYINEWSLTYGMRNVGKNKNQKGKELFISNYPIFQKENKNTAMIPHRYEKEIQFK